MIKQLYEVTLGSQYGKDLSYAVTTESVIADNINQVAKHYSCKAAPVLGIVWIKEVKDIQA